MQQNYVLNILVYVALSNDHATSKTHLFHMADYSIHLFDQLTVTISFTI